MQLPRDADPHFVYVADGYCPGEAEPFVRAVWFTPDVADELSGRAHGSHLHDTRLLRTKWLAAAQAWKGGGTGVQSAGGLYAELGVGVLPGPSRGSTRFSNDSRSTRPFPRHPELSDEMEPTLSDFMSDVSVVLHAVLPQHAMEEHLPPPNCEPAACTMYQYPRLRHGVPWLSSHQVVLRGPRPNAAGNTCSADQEAVESLSDLHVDSFDGGHRLGAVTVHTCHHSEGGVGGEDHACYRDSRHLAHRGVAVLAGKTGGRGVHIHSMVPGWHCAFVFRTRELLHGSIFLGVEERRGFALPGFDFTRVVTYPLRRVETMLERLGEDPGRFEELHSQSHEWVKKRVRL